ncbi:MAG TPA: GPP34 family phosphoprotein [Jiangellaceae bacterium]|nr:GPP34 family phosphoprotein [Jiangellaceae bacterium]
MTIADDYMTLLYSPATGRPVRWIQSSYVRSSLVGAILIELTQLGRIRVRDTDPVRLEVTSTEPVDDPLLGAALSAVAENPDNRADDHMVSLVGSGHATIDRVVLDRLVTSGQFHHARARAWRLIPIRRWYPVNLTRRETMRHRIHAVLVDGEPADRRTMALIALLEKSVMVYKILDRLPRPEDAAMTDRIFRWQTQEWSLQGEPSVLTTDDVRLVSSVKKARQAIQM